eukprot:5540412-Prymnesium_polylepis.1
MAPRKRARGTAAEPAEAAPRVALSGGREAACPDGMVQLWREGSLCDAVITVEGRAFHAHRL